MSCYSFPCKVDKKSDSESVQYISNNRGNHQFMVKCYYSLFSVRKEQ